MNQSFRVLSKSAKLGKNISKVGISKVSVGNSFSKSSFAQATSASSSSYIPTYSKPSLSFSTATTQSSNGSIINRNTANSGSAPAFLEILALGEDDDDR